MEYPPKSMYNYMVGRTASVISPFYFLLPSIYKFEITMQLHQIYQKNKNQIEIPPRYKKCLQLNIQITLQSKSMKKYQIFTNKDN